MATVTARVDENVKKEAENLFKKMGLNMSTAMNLFLKKCILEQGIPFELKVPNKETLKAMQETEDILSGKIERKGYNSAEELFEDSGFREIKDQNLKGKICTKKICFQY